MSEDVTYKINSYKNQATLPGGKSYFSVVGNNIDKTKCSMALIGKNMPNYGEAQSENYLHLLQNFCSSDAYAPGVEEPAVEGQLWYEKLDDGSYNLKVCTTGGTSSNVKWDKLAHVIVASSTPTSVLQSGDLWYNTDSKNLLVYDGENSEWINIGPSDFEHKKEDSQNVRISSYNESATIVVDKDLYKTTVNNSNEPYFSKGCCALMTSKIIMKENYNDTPTEIELQEIHRCKAIIAKYVVHTNDGETCKIIGTPTYEVIAQQDRDDTTTADDWTVDISIDIQNRVAITVTAKPYNGYYTIVECYTEVERV